MRWHFHLKDIGPSVNRKWIVCLFTFSVGRVIVDPTGHDSVELSKTNTTLQRTK